MFYSKKPKNDMTMNMTKTKMLADVRNLIEPILKVFILHCKCLQGITGSLQGFPVVGNPVIHCPYL